MLSLAESSRAHLQSRDCPQKSGGGGGFGNSGSGWGSRPNDSGWGTNNASADDDGWGDTPMASNDNAPAAASGDDDGWGGGTSNPVPAGPPADDNGWGGPPVSAPAPTRNDGWGSGTAPPHFNNDGWGSNGGNGNNSPATSTPMRREDSSPGGTPATRGTAQIHPSRLAMMDPAARPRGLEKGAILRQPVGPPSEPRSSWTERRGAESSNNNSNGGWNSNGDNSPVVSSPRGTSPGGYAENRSASQSVSHLPPVEATPVSPTLTIQADLFRMRTTPAAGRVPPPQPLPIVHQLKRRPPLGREPISSPSSSRIERDG